MGGANPSQDLVAWTGVLDDGERMGKVVELEVATGRCLSSPKQKVARDLRNLHRLAGPKRTAEAKLKHNT